MQTISEICKSFFQKIVAFRRDIHRYPELGWSEYRTTSKIIEFFMDLQNELGQEAEYRIVMGCEAVDDKSRLTPPDELICAREKARAIIQGANPKLVDKMEDGLTGLWVDMHFGVAKPENAPVFALRFDIDANEVQESDCQTHTPAKLGFSSQNTGISHACGHDGHVAIGLGVALVLHSLRANLQNTQYIVRLIFQPAEEIAQGAKAMLSAGVMDCVTTLLGVHLGIQAKTPQTLICGTTHFLANTTFTSLFEGKAAHAGLSPQEGKNALLAASAAVQALYGIARHADGQSRVNVGELHCYGAPNVVPAKVTMSGETRGLTANINAHMTKEAQRICKASALMWDCSQIFNVIGHCIEGSSDETLAREVQTYAQSLGYFPTPLLSDKFWASEDFTWLLQAVQKNGGQGTFIQLGIEWGQKNRGHHTEAFSFDEMALMRGVELLAGLVLQKI